VKSQGYNRVFGGFTDIAWKISGSYQPGNGNSFIFSLKKDLNFIKFKCLNYQIEVYHRSSYVYFGNDNLLISTDCNINKDSCVKLG
jgi:hypothetical protein